MRLFAQDRIATEFGLRVFGVGIIAPTNTFGCPVDGIIDWSIANQHQDLRDASMVAITGAVVVGKLFDKTIQKKAAHIRAAFFSCS